MLGPSPLGPSPARRCQPQPSRSPASALTWPWSLPAAEAYTPENPVPHLPAHTAFSACSRAASPGRSASARAPGHTGGCFRLTQAGPPDSPALIQVLLSSLGYLRVRGLGEAWKLLHTPQTRPQWALFQLHLRQLPCSVMGASSNGAPQWRGVAIQHGAWRDMACVAWRGVT